MVKLFSVIILLTLAAFWSAEGQGTAPAASTEEGKTAGEWLEVVKAQTVEAEKYEAAHPDETKLLRGATQSLFYLSKDNIAVWPAEYRDGYNYYQDWWKKEGEAEFNKWRQDGFPARTDRHYLVLYAAAMDMYYKMINTGANPGENKDIRAYGDAIVKRGHEILLRGYSGERISASELGELRLFAMYNNQINAQPNSFLPCYQDWMKTDGAIGSQSHTILGAEAPDLTLPRMEEILARPSYSDQSPFDEMTLFRPAILNWELEQMDGYVAATGAEKAAGSLVQPKPYDGRFKNPVTLSSFRGKKPVFLMFEDATDTWTWSGEVAPLWEPLYQAVKDRVEIFFVHTSVTDQFMPGFPNSNGIIPGGIPGMKGMHPLSLEARARTAKMCYMTYPALSVPYLLDDLGGHADNAYKSGGGESSTVLVDKNGKIAFTLWNQDGCGTYMWLDSDVGNIYSIPTRNARVMNLVECNLKALMDAGGVWNKEMKPVIPDWKLSPHLESVPLTAVDATTGAITVTDKDKKAVTITVDGQSRIMQGGERKTLADLKPGQSVSVSYEKDAAKGSGWVARVVAIGDLSSYWYPLATTWVPAVVNSIDLKQGVMQVKMTLSVTGCKGPAFWETASPEMIKGFGSNATSIPQAFKKVAALAGQVLTLHIDRATDLFLDGMTAKLSEIKVGDQMGIELAGDAKADDAWPHFVRVYRY